MNFKIYEYQSASHEFKPEQWVLMKDNQNQWGSHFQIVKIKPHNTVEIKTGLKTNILVHVKNRYCHRINTTIYWPSPSMKILSQSSFLLNNFISINKWTPYSFAIWNTWPPCPLTNLVWLLWLTNNIWTQSTCAISLSLVLTNFSIKSNLINIYYTRPTINLKYISVLEIIGADYPSPPESHSWSSAMNVTWILLNIKSIIRPIINRHQWSKYSPSHLYTTEQGNITLRHKSSSN
jgi:hypothetical protein